MSRLSFLLGALAPLALAACGGEPEPPAPPPEPLVRNLLLISLDTLRADRLGVYGSENDTSPVLDELASRSIVFQNAVAECSWTIPSHLTMLTGLYPSNHGVQDDKTRLPLDVATLAELLQAEGVRTFGEADGAYLSRPKMFGRGFDEYRSERRGLRVILPAVDSALRGMAEGDRYFGFVHSYDIHCPYDPPLRFRHAFHGEGSEPIDVDGRCPNLTFNKMDLTPGQVRYISDCYDGGVLYVDTMLGEFLKRLESTGVLADTALLFVSDHGEEFQEHGRIGHQATLHVEQLRVPMILYVPGLAPQVIEEPVGLADVMPTVLELLGVAPPAGLDGRSLVPLLRGEELPGTGGFRFSEVEKQRKISSWMSPEAHLLLDHDTDEVKLYDLLLDPTEQHDLAAEQPERAAELRRTLEAFIDAQTGRRSGQAEGREADDAALQREISDLGYGGDD
jgi:arylsulfatase A-like enzyme